jgi:ammonia channel protein AmtB
VAAQFLLGLGLKLIPFAGGLVMGFVNAYAALAIGCTLGLRRLSRRARELGWD